MSCSTTRLPHEPDYIARTIATVRNHRGADNCWPQWANIFADQIEALMAALDEKLSVESADAWLAHRFHQVYNERDALLSELSGLRERNDTLERALVEAGVPLEVMRAQIAASPYRELSTRFQSAIVEASDIVRAALAVVSGEREDT